MSNDAGSAVPREASSDSMQAQTPLAKEGNSDRELALSPLHQAANSASAGSSPSAGIADGQEATPSGQESTPSGQEATPSGQEATTSGQEATASGQEVRSVLDSVQSLTGPEMQSPNKSKYARSESRPAGTKIAEHPVGELDCFCLRTFPS